MIIRLLVILITNLLMYSRSINYDYQIDDLDVSRRVTPTKGKWQLLWQHFMGIKYTNAKLARCCNIAVHSAVCMLIYFAFGRNNISFLTAVLFSLNPVNNQVSVWLSGRSYGTAAMFLLLGMSYLPLLPIVYSLGIMITASVLFAPLLFLVKSPHWAVLLLLIGIYIGKRVHKPALMNRIAWGTKTMIRFNWGKLIIFFKTLGYYLALCILPIRLGMFHTYLHTFGLSEEESKPWYKLDHYFFLGVALVGYLLYKLVLGFSAFDFGLFWFVLFTVQWCNLIVLNHPISERYIYLSNIGLMYSLSQLIIFTPLMWIFLTFYAVRLFYFLPCYKNRITFWKSNNDNFPSVAMAYNQLGIEQAQFGNTGSALDSFICGVQKRPDDFRLNYNVANILIGAGQLHLSVKFLKKAEQVVNKNIDFEYWNGEIGKMREILKGAKLWQ